MKVLICGERSYVATGLVARLTREGLEVHTFSRGPSQRNGTTITGDVFDMVSESHLDSHYDHVINFIIIKNDSVSENLRYVSSLLAFCEKIGVQSLLQVSSISVYATNAATVTEATPIAETGTPRGPYATIKQEVDHALLGSSAPFRIAFLRVGYVLEPERVPWPLAGISRRLVPGLSLLLGSRETTLPIIKRGELHDAIAVIVRQGVSFDVYLLFDNEGMTKYRYATRATPDTLLWLPKRLSLGIAGLLRSIGVFSPSQFAQVEGLFRETRYDSHVTEERLKLRFTI